jgi:DNA-binding NarL/FixJ family response regulator
MKLTGQEKAVLRLVDLGLTNKAIADRLDIALQTVKNHLNAVNKKLTTKNRAMAFGTAMAKRLL